MPDAEVIAELHRLIKSEISAMAQYRLHAQILRNQGFQALKHKLHHIWYDENHHSKELMNRLLFLGEQPQPEDLVADPPEVGEDAHAMFLLNLAKEKQAIEDYNAATEKAMDAGDNGTAKLLRHILKEEEGHAYWLEKQIAIIVRIGEANYLATKLEE